MAGPEVVYRLSLELLGNYHLESLDQRIQQQKALYLFQSCVADLDFSFNWYIYGPYSPDLTKVLFSIEQDREKVRAGGVALGKIPNHIREPLDALKNIIDDVPELLSKTHWLEALASVKFLKRRKKPADQIISKLSEDKPYLSDNVVRRALTAVNSI